MNFVCRWITGVKGKVYGLQKPAPPAAAKKNVFSFGDDDDDDTSIKKVKVGGSSLDSSKIVSSGQLSASKFLKYRPQTQKKLAEALAEDPSAFDYDGVYDTIQKSREGPTISERKKEAKQPKYINSLLKQAAERKREDQRLDEKRIVKEREDEQNEVTFSRFLYFSEFKLVWQFGDTEMFLTSGYKKKLQENRKWDEVSLSIFPPPKNQCTKNRLFETGGFFETGRCFSGTTIVAGKRKEGGCNETWNVCILFQLPQSKFGLGSDVEAALIFFQSSSFSHLNQDNVSIGQGLLKEEKPLDFHVDDKELRPGSAHFPFCYFFADS